MDQLSLHGLALLVITLDKARPKKAQVHKIIHLDEIQELSRLNTINKGSNPFSLGPHLYN